MTYQAEHTVADYLLYEQPLNERVRTFLRVEHLFDKVHYYIDIPDIWSSRLAIHSILELNDLLGRSDIKTEVIKELERHATTLIALNSNPGVDVQRLQSVLDNINEYLQELRDKSCQPGQKLKQDELMSAIKQRHSIPGGTCNFDLPGYHYWLHIIPEERSRQLRDLISDFSIIRNSVGLALNMIRNSTNPSREIATRGFYQKPIESNLACQLIRIKLPTNTPYFPEISGGKHRFSVRFMQQDSTLQRPVQTETDVEFELHCCVL